MNETSWSNRPAEVRGVPARSAKVSTTSSSAASAQTAAADAAYRVACTRRWVVARSGARNAASPSSPTVAAAARVLTLDTSGTPQRTSTPGSASSRGDVAPVIRAATNAPSRPGGHREPEGAREAGCALDRRALGGGHAHQRRYCGRMSLHPPAPSDLNGLVDAWAQTVQSVIDLGRTMRPDDARAAHRLPGLDGARPDRARRERRGDGRRRAGARGRREPAPARAALVRRADGALRRVPPRARARGGARRARGAPRRAPRRLPRRHRVGRARGPLAVRAGARGRPARHPHLRRVDARAGRARGPGAARAASTPAPRRTR